MTAGAPATIRCSTCGTLNHFSSQLCENCKMPLADERNVFRAARAGAIDDSSAPRPAPHSIAGAVSGPDLSDEGQGLRLSYTPIVLYPDPFFGPIFRRTVRYFLSHAAVEVRAGLISKRRRQVEMYRIGSREGDMYITQGPLQRIKGTGTLIIRSSDPDLPHLALRDIHDPEQVQARIRYNAALAQRERSPLNLGGDFHPISEF